MGTHFYEFSSLNASTVTQRNVVSFVNLDSYIMMESEKPQCNIFQTTVSKWNGLTSKNSLTLQLEADDPEAGGGKKCTAWMVKLRKQFWFICVWTTLRILLVLVFMYFFICALSLVSDAFRLIAGAKVGHVFQHNQLLQNPVIDLMIGMLVTMAIHSSGTTTAVMISMTAANIIPVDNAIYVLFGAEVGTSITNTIVSMAQIADRERFGRAFSSATMHSVFNWLTVLIFFPLEVETHMLRLCAEAMTEHLNTAINPDRSNGEYFSAILKPFTNQIIRLDETLINAIALRDNLTNFTTLIEPTGHFIFAHTTLSDTWSGVILLICSLAILFACLVGISKTMKSMLASHLARAAQRHINTDLPGRWKPLTGYVFIVAGAVITAIVQSSTVFTSTLTPMVGLGMISMERVFPLILGANVGTTMTTVWGALAQDARVAKVAMIVALWQMLFNFFGVVLFYPIPFLRNMVIKTGKWLGRNTRQYRWFVAVYIIVLFILLPLLGIGLSAAGPMVSYCVGVPFTVFIVGVCLINAVQSQKPMLLPLKLRNWDWLPAPMHSLEPYDRWLSKLYCRCRRYTLEHVGNH